MPSQFERDIDNLNESDVKIGNKSFYDKELRQLWAKSEMIYRRLADYWTPLVKQGKTCMDFLHGKIFDESIRAYYENVQGKVVIEPRVMKPRLNVICNHISQTRRSGKLVSEGGASADELYRANLLLKFFSDETQEQAKLEHMLFTGCATGYPQVMTFDRSRTAFGDPLNGLIVDTPPWDSYVLSEFTKPDGSDVSEFIRIGRKTMAEMIDENPDREDAIRKHYKDHKSINPDDYSAMLKSTDGLTVEDIRYLTYDMITGLAHSRMDGRLMVMDRWFPVRRRRTIAVSRVPQAVDVLDYQILPASWPAQRKNEWLSQHPEYEIIEDDIKVLWHSRWTREGLWLMNEEHEFQEHDNRGNPILPLAVFVPQMIDGLPCGPGPDMRYKILMKAIAETEHLHAVRKGSGDLLAYMKGTITNADTLSSELSRDGGVIEIDPESVQGGSIDSALKLLKRTPNETYGAYSEKVSNDLMQEDLVTPSIMGQYVQNQPAKSQQLNIGQTVAAYAHVSKNFNHTFERVKNLQCMHIPYVMTEETVLMIEDEERQESMAVPINQREYDLEGNAHTDPTTDLSGFDWRFRLVPGDDSPTARQQELNDLNLFWASTAPALIEADETLGLLSSTLMSLGNKTASDVGRLIGEKAQIKAEQLNQQQMAEITTKVEEQRSKAQAEKIKALRSGFSFSITPEDLVQHPEVFGMLVDRQYINPSSYQFQMPPGGAGEPQQQIPA